MVYQLNYINERLRTDPRGYADECEDEYDAKVSLAARQIADNRARSPIVLLSGPSGSGKTTTAKRICDELETFGLEARTVSLDDYFLSPKMFNAPRTPEGDIDYESPECIDWELLNEHFTQLSRGEEICIPHFSFSIQSRSASKSTPICITDRELVIFEGIHALNDRVTSPHPEAYKLYISARSSIEDGKKVVYQGTWARLVRRVIRDDLFRGADPMVTLAMWANVRRGEKAYISPYKNSANLLLDTLLPYEFAAMRAPVEKIFAAASPDIERFDQVREIQRSLRLAEPFDTSIIPDDSILREFLGGGKYTY
jgi:uridine kinase